LFHYLRAGFMRHWLFPIYQTIFVAPAATLTGTLGGFAGVKAHSRLCKIVPWIDKDDPLTVKIDPSTAKVDLLTAKVDLLTVKIDLSTAKIVS
jgi:hypothetical protein